MELSSLLDIGPGVTAVIGGGGKTTLLHALAEELRAGGRVLLCTSTHIRRPAQYPLIRDTRGLPAALARYGVVCTGEPSTDGKLTAPAASFSHLSALADFVLTEADGSRGLPLKAHAPHEPVIPENTGRTVLVIGADGFGRPIREVCHRPERFAALAGASPEDPVTPDLCAAVIRAEGLGDIVFVNKAETPAAREAAASLAKRISLPLVAGSLYRREYSCLY